MLSDFRNRIKYFKQRKIRRIVTSLFKVLVVTCIGTYVIAFAMKDSANNEWVKQVCREYVYGPKNIVALVVNKFVPGTMEVNSVLVPTPQNVAEMTAEEKSIRGLFDRYKKQAAIDEQLKKEYEAGGYTLDEPFLVVNPYGNSPLTALIMFDTEEDMLASIRVIGKSQEEDVSFDFGKQGYCKKHVIPVYGLYAEYENTVIISLSTRGGQKYSREVKIRTDSLPEDYKKINLITYHGKKSEDIASGFNFSHCSLDGRGIKFAFDKYGNIRWLFVDDSLFVGTNYMNGKCLYRTFGGFTSGDAIIVKESYMGKIEQLFYLPNGMHHDLFYTNDNTLLATTGYGESWLDSLLELDIDTGNIVNDVYYGDLLPRGRKIGLLHGDIHDWAHINAVVEHQGNYISSSNFQSAVFKHSKDNHLKWILSDPQYYPMYWQQYMLRPIGDDFEYPYNQHAVEVLPDYDNNPDTVDILLFDNGSSRNDMNKWLQEKIKLNKVVEPPLYSRLVHYRINEKNMTVEQIWQYGKERPELFSCTRGDADLLYNGNILGVFNCDRGSIDKIKEPYYYSGTVYCEVNRMGEVVWECYATNKATSNRYLDYRLSRNDIYNKENDYLDLFVETKNFVPDEILRKYGY